MLKALFAVAALSLLPSFAIAQTKAPAKDPARQAKQEKCRAEAKAKNLKGAQQDLFMKECKARP